MDNTALMARIRALPVWRGEINAMPLDGGITNVNFIVEDAAAKYVVRVGEDIVEHHVMRFNELAASRAAHAAGLSPAVVHAEAGLTVLEFIDSTTFTPDDIRKQENLERIVPLIRSCHRNVAEHLRGPALIFWVFHVIRDYAATLREGNSAYGSLLPDLLQTARKLENDAAPFDIVFGHNDLLAANFLDDGTRLWLIDWDYAGFNTPLFDLGGLASNSGLSADQETWLLENYFEKPETSELRHRYEAMKCASLLRETMWSMVSEIKSTLEFDYAQYTADNLASFRAAYDIYKQT